jgi:hypothetical protein
MRSPHPYTPPTEGNIRSPYCSSSHGGEYKDAHNVVLPRRGIAEMI